LITIALALTLQSGASAQQAARATSTPTVIRTEGYYRTELYMGMSIPGGSTVSEEAWEKFLSEIVTPLFPSGFTVLGGRGQYREASGTIAKETSHVLVFLYPKVQRKKASIDIEKIRSEYKKQFSQESVLRVDITKSVKVSF
jgi:hypothetical protein